MKTIKLTPGACSVTTIKDSKRVDYKVVYYYETITLKADFFSVNKYGFGLISNNSICVN